MKLQALFYSIGQLAGISAYIFLSFLVFLGDTARFWDKYIGLDKIIKFQRKFSYFTFAFILLHPLFFIASSGFKNISGFLIPNFAYFGLALGIIAFYIYVSVMIASYFYKRVSYKSWQFIHVLTYILVFGALAHAFLSGSNKDDYIFIYAISFVLLVIGIIFRTSYKIKGTKNNKYKVLNVQQETEDSFTLNLEKKKDFKFEAGQFCFIRINGERLYARHPFTISSSPSQDQFSFTIKLAGRFTKVAKDLKEGDYVIIDGPFGKFVPSKNSAEKDLVFFAGGVGITPFISIIREAIIKNKNQKITLFYCTRTGKDLIFKNELDSINKDWFKKVYFLSRENKNEDGFENGYLTEELILKYAPNIKDSHCYICGPEQMKNLLIPQLKNMGVNNVFKEDFFW